MPSKNKVHDDVENEEMCRIAMINFAYNNSNIISQLKQRGSLIKAEQWDELQKMNQKMTDQFRTGPNSEKLIDSVQRPVTCFITFEYEEGKHRASNYNNVAKNIAEYKHY